MVRYHTILCILCPSDVFWRDSGVSHVSTFDYVGNQISHQSEVQIIQFNREIAPTDTGLLLLLDVVCQLDYEETLIICE